MSGDLGLGIVEVAVLLGGPSAEREVSLRTGEAVSRALERLGHRVHRVDPVPGALSLPGGVRVVFLALHGTYGEDGSVQRELEALGVPYTGTGIEGSRIAFDKILAKEKCLAAGVPTPRYARVRDPLAALPEGLKLPLVLKPVRQGSSVGLRFVDEPAGWAEAVAAVLPFDGEILVEEKISGREVTVGILDGRTLPVVEVRPRQGAYDYANKYTPGSTEYLCPAPLDPGVEQAVRSAALGAFEAVGGRDYSRVDVMIDASGAPHVLEVNTLPGMTETSLLPKAAAAAGIGFDDLCQRMIALALRRGLA